MPDWLTRIRSQAGELWQKLSAPLRWLLVGVTLALIAALIFTVRSPRLQDIPVPGQPFDPKDLPAVTAKLADLGVPYRASADGTIILVPKDRLLDARLALAQAGVPGGPAGYELFDKSNLSATDFERKVNLLRAMEGELSRSITALGPVKTAVVKLAIPERSVFVRDTKPVKAAVMVEARAGRALSGTEVEGIIRFIAGAVAELDPENVMVIDSGGAVLAAGLAAAEPAGPGRSGAQLNQQTAYEAGVEERLRTSLEQSLGVGNVTVMVSAKLNFDLSREETTSFANPGDEPIRRSNQTSSVFFEGSGVPVLPPAGVDANTPAPPIYQSVEGGGNSTYEAQDVLENFEINEIRRVVERPPGSIEAITVGVFVNETIVPATDAARLAQIQEVVAAAVGTPRDLVTVATMPFNNDLITALMEGIEAGPAASSRRQIILIAAAIAVAAILTWLLMRRRPALTLAPARLSPAPAFAEAAGTRAGDPLAEQMELLGEDFLTPAGLDPARRHLREEVERLARHSPETVASLIKAWLAEEK